jgi:hypothetical protein
MGYLQARQSLNGLSGPVFKNSAGQVISSIVCGQPYTFDVPGYTRVWLRQYKNGQVNFDGIFPVPMSSYMADCVKDVGTYDNVVGEVASSGGIDNAMGARIGDVSFRVTPAVTTPTTVTPPNPVYNGPGDGGGGVTLTFKPGSRVPVPVTPPVYSGPAGPDVNAGPDPFPTAVGLFGGEEGLPLIGLALLGVFLLARRR